MQIEEADDIKTCAFFEKFEDTQDKLRLPNGVYTLDDLKEFSES